jgi:hypothetical protein
MQQTESVMIPFRASFSPLTTLSRPSKPIKPSQPPVLSKWKQHKRTHLLSSNLSYLLPPLYSQLSMDDPKVYARFCAPDLNWAWYVIEGSPEDDDYRFFGYFCGDANEWREFTLSELEAIRGPWGHAVEPDLAFAPQTFLNVLGHERHHWWS